MQANTKFWKATGKIEKLNEYTDKRGNKFYVMKLENETKSLFAFSSEKYDLEGLIEGETYEFDLKEGRNAADASIVVSFNPSSEE